MYRRFTATGAMASVVAIAISACTTTKAFNEIPPDDAPVLAMEDGASPAPEAGLIQYCPTSECPVGYTTCPTSSFRCDVNLMTDTENCGACGVVCPRSEVDLYSCIDGRCVLQCNSFNARMDCNDAPDDGCETTVRTNDNCAGCGDECPAGKPCADQTGSGDTYGCGCPEHAMVCNVSGRDICLDGRNDDQNCGECDKACDPAGDGGSVPDHAYYGCFNGECGHLKCAANFGDCDNNVKANGCETSLLTNENCGQCGNVCPEGQFCALQPIGLQIIVGCVCEPGLTFCGARGEGPVPSIGVCYDLTSDVDHCGSCDVACAYALWQHASASCEYGACKMTCMQGWANCNGNTDDDCETNTDNDPNNCGGCGIKCDAVAGQACVRGQCAVAPCEQDGGLLR